MKRVIPVVAFTLLVLPVVAGAQGELTEVSSFLNNIVKFINNTLVPLIFAIAFLFFLWGVAQYFILGRDAEEAKDKGRNYMLWGIGGFVVMVSVWGIVNLVADGFGFSRDERIQNIPNVELRND